MILLWTNNQCSIYSGDRQVLQQTEYRVDHVADLIQFPFDRLQILPVKPGTCALLRSCPSHLIQAWTPQN